MTFRQTKCEESASSLWKKEAASVTMAYWEMAIDKKNRARAGIEPYRSRLSLR